jgi:hypothetical protein
MAAAKGKEKKGKAAEESKAEETKTEEGKTDEGNAEGKKKQEEKKKKPKKSKAKTAKSEMGGKGQYSDKTYEKILKTDMDYVRDLISSRTPLPQEEEDFVDWVLNTKDGRALHEKYKKAAQSKCKCIIL